MVAVAPNVLFSSAFANAFDPAPATWRTFKLTTAVTLPATAAPVRAWIPVPDFVESAWMQPHGTTWQGNASSAGIVRTGKWGVAMLYAQWSKRGDTAVLKATSVVSTRDRNVNLQRPQHPARLSDDRYRLYTSATDLQPTTGLVAQTAQKIAGSASSDLAKARLIYEWIVANSARNPKTRGCGLGDVTFMLQTGDFSGKCADINGLYVALVRAQGIPARDLYGIRVAPSRFGYKSLGANSDVVTKAQHCRAEVYLSDFGWVPADPADVRKVMLEEPPGNLPASNPKVVDAKQTLFGAWEGNYVAYNDGHDVALPGSTGPQLGFLMYPQAEIVGERRDSLSPTDFVYTIDAEEIASSK